MTLNGHRNLVKRRKEDAGKTEEMVMQELQDTNPEAYEIMCARARSLLWEALSTDIQAGLHKAHEAGFHALKRAVIVKYGTPNHHTAMRRYQELVNTRRSAFSSAQEFCTTFTSRMNDLRGSPLFHHEESFYGRLMVLNLDLPQYDSLQTTAYSSDSPAIWNIDTLVETIRQVDEKVLSCSSETAMKAHRIVTPNKATTKYSITRIDEWNQKHKVCSYWRHQRKARHQLAINSF